MEFVGIEEQERKLEGQGRNDEEEQATVANLKSMALQQQKEMANLTATRKDQAGQIQKVSQQSEIARPAPRLVSGRD